MLGLEGLIVEVSWWARLDSRFPALFLISAERLLFRFHMLELALKNRSSSVSDVGFIWFGIVAL